MASPFRWTRGDQTDRAKLLVVGYGTRGRQWVAACKEAGFRVAGVVDPQPAAAELAAAAGLTCSSSLAQALERGGADAAVVASPPGHHVADATACVEASLAVLLEKPAALSLASAQQLAAVAQAAGRQVVVGQNFRFLDRERTIRRVLEAGTLGRVVAVSILSARPLTAAAPHLADVRYGPLWDIALHHLDALRGRFGEPATVDASGSAMAGSDRRELALQVEWPTGPTLSYRHVEGAPVFHHHEWIEGTEAALVVNGSRVQLAPPGARWRLLRASRASQPDQALLAAFSGVLDGSADASGLSLADNLGTIAVVEAAQTSLDLGSRVAVAEERAA